MLLSVVLYPLEHTAEASRPRYYNILARDIITQSIVKTAELTSQPRCQLRNTVWADQKCDQQRGDAGYHARLEEHHNSGNKYNTRHDTEYNTRRKYNQLAHPIQNPSD